MKHLNQLLAGLLLMCAVVGLSAQQRPQVKNPFEIKRGVNISHWLSQSKRFGEERKAYFTEEDAELIRTLGFDHVRLPYDEVHLWNEDGTRTEGFALMHQAIGWFMKRNLKVIVDFHIPRSHYFNDKAGRELFKQQAAQDKFVSLWLDLQKELKKYPVKMVAYEIMNEPVADNPEDWNRIVDVTIKALRKSEKNRKIFVGSNKWNGCATFKDLVVPADDKNLVLTFHFYDPHMLTHHQASWSHIRDIKVPVQYPGVIMTEENYLKLSPELQKKVNMKQVNNRESLEANMLKAIEVADKYGLQIHCGEFGCYKNFLPEDIALRWYKDVLSLFRQYNIAWSAWDYKGGFGVVKNDRSVYSEPILKEMMR